MSVSLQDSIWSTHIIEEDNHILVVYKPFGLPTQGDKTGDPSLLDHYREYLRTAYDKPGNVYLGLVHRLDRPVAGIVVLAKTSKAAARLSEQFRERTVSKTYRAWVEGWPPAHGTLIHELSPGPANKVSVSERPSAESQCAELSYRVVKRASRESLVEIDLKTGRKHQIRAQFSYAGFPIVGDTKYEGRRWDKSRAVALVGYSLGFDHPVRGERKVFSLEAGWFEGMF